MAYIRMYGFSCVNRGTIKVQVHFFYKHMRGAEMRSAGMRAKYSSPTVLLNTAGNGIKRRVEE
jgi:hypothetical protein